MSSISFRGVSVAAQCSALACGGRAAEGPALYRSRRPAQIVLYRVIQGHLETYLSASRAAEDADFDPVPRFIEREFRCYRDKLKSHSDIPQHSGLSANDVRYLRELYPLAL